MYIADATYLTFTAELASGYLEKIRVTTTAKVVKEAIHNAASETARAEIRKHVEIIKSERPALDKNFRNLSFEDKELLQTVVRYKDECLLITDDGLLKIAAEKQRVKVFSTPGFIVHLTKNNKIEKSNALNWLEGLKRKYPRQKLLAKKIEKIKNR